MIKKTAGFTLIELLVVISIIGILLALSVFGLQGARESSRDARRKADLESIRSGLEIYKADCDKYPLTAKVSGGSALVGLGSPSSCVAANTYISKIPVDPIPGTYAYAYSSDGTTYTLCATLEQPPSVIEISDCGSCPTGCNYKVKNP